ncbi:hypothetical protein BG000_009127 [Podila horticola]|nr:hypothetical protein BG000_009127 [Podila horticola]
MVALKQRIAQQWPRFTVSLYAVWGLIAGLSTLWFGLQLNSLTEKEFLNLTGLGPEKEDRLVKLWFVFIGSFSVITNGIALYAAIRKSVWATKASLVVWFAEISWFVLFFCFALIGFLSMSDSERSDLPRPSAWDWIKITLNGGLTLFNGWALLVFLRDLKHRQRNVWGQLVRTGGVFEYEPIGAFGAVHL